MACVTRNGAALLLEPCNSVFALLNRPSLRPVAVNDTCVAVVRGESIFGC